MASARGPWRARPGLATAPPTATPPPPPLWSSGARPAARVRMHVTHVTGAAAGPRQLQQGGTRRAAAAAAVTAAQRMARHVVSRTPRQPAAPARRADLTWRAGNSRERAARGPCRSRRGCALGHAGWARARGLACAYEHECSYCLVRVAPSMRRRLPFFPRVRAALLLLLLLTRPAQWLPRGLDSCSRPAASAWHKVSLARAPEIPSPPLNRLLSRLAAPPRAPPRAPPVRGMAGRRRRTRRPPAGPSAAAPAASLVAVWPPPGRRLDRLTLPRHAQPPRASPTSTPSPHLAHLTSLTSPRLAAPVPAARAPAGARRGKAI